MAKKPTKYGNLYDVDGNLIRHCNEHGEQTRWSIDETEDLVDRLTKKVQDNPDSEVYKVYLNNAQRVLYAMYDNMSREELVKRLTVIQDSIKASQEHATTDEEKTLGGLNLSIDQIKQLYEENTPKDDAKTGENTENEVPGSAATDSADTTNEELGDDETDERKLSDIQEGRSISQSDLLVERDDVTTNMDEYVDFEEVG